MIQVEKQAQKAPFSATLEGARARVIDKEKRRRRCYGAGPSR